MKTLRQLCVALVLTLALTIPALAGEIQLPPAPPPPPQVATYGEISTPGAPGTIDTPPGEIGTPPGGASAVDPATVIALNLLQSVLSLF